jgi:hypothetical protein
MVRVRARLLALVLAGVAAPVLGPAGCFFPEYTFDLGSSSTGTGAGGATSSTSSTTSTGSGGGAPEDCLNGADDDGDGNIDCADPKCALDYECVDPAPSGWTAPGLVALYEGSSSQSPPSCPAEMGTKVYGGKTGFNAPASCSPCGCAPPAGQDCKLTTDLNPSVSGIQAMQVSNMPCFQAATQLNTLTVPDPWAGACFHQETLPGGQTCNGQPCNTSVQSTLPTVSGGTCTPTGGAADGPAPTWSSAAVACTGSRFGGGCQNGRVCAPKPKTPFKSHVCVEQSGDVSCPSGSAYSNKNVYYQDFDDQRDCTACQCGSASGGSCEITLSLWSDPSLGTCTTPAASFKAGQCQDLGGNPAIYGWTEQITKPPSGGKCSPTTTSTPLGQATPKTPTTFCCL